MNFNEKVYKECKKIPKGKVSTYKEIGKKLNTRAYRAIGQALKNNPYPIQVPCHRVVSSQGKLHGFKGKTKGKALKEKQRMLEEEGLTIINNKIKDFEEKLFKF